MSKKAGRIALGLGLLTGAVSGLLFAPEEGKKIRKKILSGDTKGIAKDLAQVGDDIVDTLVKIAKNPSVVDAVSGMKDRAAEVANMKSEELDAMLKKAHTRANQFKNHVTKYVKEQKSMLEKRFGSAKKAAKKTVSKTAKKAAPKKAATKKVKGRK